MRIALLGDIALIGKYDRTIKNDVDMRIAKVREIVDGCDYVIANLETPLTKKTTTLACKGVYLRSDPINVKTLVNMGITHVTIANNHLFDYGRIGAMDTIRTLEEAGIRYVGIGNGPEILRQGNNAVLLEGFCCLSANALNYGNHPGKVNILTPKTLKYFLNTAETKEYLPIVSVHYGLEGLHYPSIEHLRLFREMAKKHRYILQGNHPHAIQGFEVFNQSILLYAQGNLCFDKTPVTSIRSVPKETAEDRKGYISIVTVNSNIVTDMTLFGMTDMKTSLLHEDKRVVNELRKYSNILQLSEQDIIKARDEEINRQIDKRDKRDIKFYLNRLNYRYLGAYLNGRRHERQYSKVFSKFINSAREDHKNQWSNN